MSNMLHTIHRLVHVIDVLRIYYSFQLPLKTIVPKQPMAVEVVKKWEFMHKLLAPELAHAARICGNVYYLVSLNVDISERRPERGRHTSFASETLTALQVFASSLARDRIW